MAQKVTLIEFGNTYVQTFLIKETCYDAPSSCVFVIWRYASYQFFFLSLLDFFVRLQKIVAIYKKARCQSSLIQNERAHFVVFVECCTQDIKN